MTEAFGRPKKKRHQNWLLGRCTILLIPTQSQKANCRENHISKTGVYFGWLSQISVPSLPTYNRTMDYARDLINNLYYNMYLPNYDQAISKLTLIRPIPMLCTRTKNAL